MNNEDILKLMFSDEDALKEFLEEGVKDDQFLWYLCRAVGPA